MTLWVSTPIMFRKHPFVLICPNNLDTWVHHKAKTRHNTEMPFKAYGNILMFPSRICSSSESENDLMPKCTHRIIVDNKNSQIGCHLRCRISHSWSTAYFSDYDVYENEGEISQTRKMFVQSNCRVLVTLLFDHLSRRSNACLLFAMNLRSLTEYKSFSFGCK